jgi:putative Mg2+ transporter-C (MgtC) family protein
MSIAHQIWTVVEDEFSDVGDLEAAIRTSVRLSLAALLGGVLGFEREGAGSNAGLRTHMLVAVGSALFVVAPLLAGMSIADLSRVLQGLTTGIGFIGAGAIIKHRQDVKGLTTAASVWVTAAIGVAVGMGQEGVAIVSTTLALIILSVLRRLKQ